MDETESEPDAALNPPSYAADASNPVNLVSSAAGAPTVYADGCLYAIRTQGVVRLTFVEAMFEPIDSPNPGQKTRHVGTLIMPLEGFRGTITYLSDLAAEWREGEADGQ